MDNIPKLASEKDEEDFKTFETKVETVMKILQEMNSTEKNVQDNAIKDAKDFMSTDLQVNEVDESTFIVKVRENRTIINTKKDDPPANGPVQMDKFTFMQQIETDSAKRHEVQKEREKIAQNFRSLGNEAFRKQEFEKAINMYTKAIDHVKNSPILYNNRALCYIKLDSCKRAIIDCDYVLQKLDDKNLRALLYRASAYHKLCDEKNFEKSIKLAKKHNAKEIEYIDSFVEKLMQN